MDGSPSDGAASASCPHTGLDTGPVARGAEGVGTCEEAGAQGAKESRKEEDSEEGCKEEACKESRSKEADQEEGGTKEADQEEGREEGRATADQKVRQEASEEARSPEITLRP
jgi:hypothetical protein